MSYVYPGAYRNSISLGKQNFYKEFIIRRINRLTIEQKRFIVRDLLAPYAHLVRECAEGVLMDLDLFEPGTLVKLVRFVCYALDQDMPEYDAEPRLELSPTEPHKTQ